MGKKIASSFKMGTRVIIAQFPSSQVDLQPTYPCSSHSCSSPEPWVGSQSWYSSHLIVKANNGQKDSVVSIAVDKLHTSAKAANTTIYNFQFQPLYCPVCYVLVASKTDKEQHTGLLNSTLRTKKRNERKT